MRVIALSSLKVFWENNQKHQDAREPCLAWYRHALATDWASPAAVKADFGNASILKDGRVVYIRFIGTHRQYDAIDAQTI